MRRLIEFVLARIPLPAASAVRPGPAPVDRVVDERPVPGPGIPAPSAGCRPAVPVPGPVLWNEPHAGCPDLVRWPVSAAEARVAQVCIAGAHQVTNVDGQVEFVNELDAWVALLEITGSADRATAVLARVRYERELDVVAARAFGVMCS